jgi:hypothetical protein
MNNKLITNYYNLLQIITTYYNLLQIAVIIFSWDQWYCNLFSFPHTNFFVCGKFFSVQKNISEDYDFEKV